MKRGLCLIAASLLLGIYAAYYVPFTVLAWLVLPVLLCVLLKWVISCRNFRMIYAAAAAVLVFGAGLLLWQNEITQKKIYPFLDEFVDVTAVVTDRPVRSENKVILEAKVTELTFLGERVYPNEKVRLRCGDENSFLDFGDVFTARIRVNVPREASNTGGFDYSLFLKTRNIFFSGYIDSGSLTVVGQKKFHLIDRIRMLGFRCADLIDRVLTPETACILKGILLGDKSGIGDELYTAFSRSGLSHIVAFSGTHVSSLLVLIFAFFQLFGIHRRRAGIFAAVFLACFICMIGAPASAVRAGIMAVLAIAAEFIYRKADTFLSLSVAATVILCVQPFAAFDIGFLLSFGAILGILLFQPRLEHAAWSLLAGKRSRQKKSDSQVSRTATVGKKFLKLLTTAVSAQLIIVPVLLWTFQEFTFWGLITNFIVLPLLPFILGFGTLLCILGLVWEPLALLPAGLSYLALLVVRCTVLFFGTLPFGYITFGWVTSFSVFFYFLVIAALYLLLDRRKRVYALVPMGSAAALVCVLVLRSILSPPIAYVRYMNVDQGDCSCISLPGGTDILIDAGGMPSYREPFDVGQNIVRPYLLQNGISDIEYMVASHGHDDHVKGLISILKSMKVDKLLVPRGFGMTESGRLLLETAEEEGVPVTELAAGDRLEFPGGAVLSVLMPTREWADGLSEEQENERSLVLRLDFGVHSFLYTGDVEKDGEEVLVQTAGNALRTEVLKVAHHGGENSTSQQFLQAVQPDYAVISVGENHFGHPASNVLARLRACSAKIYRTDKNRDIVFKVDKNRIVHISCTE